MTRRFSTPPSVLAPRLGLFLCALVLTLIGFVMIYSASSVTAVMEGDSAMSKVGDQMMYAVLGTVAALVASRIPPRCWQSGWLLWLSWGAVVVLLVLTFVMGIAGFGAKRWLVLGPISLQPSEFAKIAFLLMAARLLFDFREGRIAFWPAVGCAVAFVIVPLGFLYQTQSDLGTTLICAMGILGVLWLGGVPLKFVGWFLAVVAVLAVVAIFGAGYRSDRMVFLDPWNDGQGGRGAGYNIIRMFYAFAEGGLFGVGLGNSHEKYQYLFASESDFIFAIIGEELGLVGVLFVIALFLAFLYCGLRIAAQAPDSFSCTLAGGLTLMLVGQAFLNMGCAMGALPTTGKPLPFISAGGSSLIATLITVGLIVSVSRATADPDVYERRRDNLRVVRSHGGAGPSAPQRAQRPAQGTGRERGPRKDAGGLRLANAPRRSGAPRGADSSGFRRR